MHPPPPAAPLAVVGLTGGIASGKSTVAAHWRARGVPVVDADQLARRVVAPGAPALADIAARFGADMIRPDGSLDRGRLGAHVFADPAELAALNGLTHARIRAAAEADLDALAGRGHRWAVYEAALLLEHDLAPDLDALVAVVCEPTTQIARILSRDGLPREQAERRLGAQTDNAARLAAADHVLWNDGPLDALLAGADALLAELTATYGGPPVTVTS